MAGLGSGGAYGWRPSAISGFCAWLSPPIEDWLANTLGAGLGVGVLLGARLIKGREV